MCSIFRPKNADFHCDQANNVAHLPMLKKNLYWPGATGLASAEKPLPAATAGRTNTLAVLLFVTSILSTNPFSSSRFLNSWKLTCGSEKGV